MAEEPDDSPYLESGTESEPDDSRPRRPIARRKPPVPHGSHVSAWHLSTTFVMVLLCCALVPILATNGKGSLPTRALAAAQVACTTAAPSSSNSSFCSAVAVTATAALAASFLLRKPKHVSTTTQEGATSAAPPSQPARAPINKGKGVRVGSLVGAQAASANAPVGAQAASANVPSVSENAPNIDAADKIYDESDSEAYGSGDDSPDEDDMCDDAPIDRGKNGKLWTKEQFPEGTKGAFSWDIENALVKLFGLL